ncbi:DM13 domain-containing protein [Amedibacillus sp. YH-ame10]
MKKTRKVYTISMVVMLCFMIAACGTGKKETKMEKDEMTEASDKSMKKEDNSMSGMFVAEMNKKTSGKVELKDNKLMLTEFVTDEGPDVHVWLTKDGNMKDGYDVSKIDLKDMDQTFEIDMAMKKDFNTVVIYCNDAESVFAKATLSMMK